MKATTIGPTLSRRWWPLNELARSDPGLDLRGPIARIDKRSRADNAALDRWANEGGAIAGVVSGAVGARGAMLTPAERQILQCLGTAVVLRWNDLPTAAQRTLFKAATAGDASGPPRGLAARISRLLHDYKNGRRTQ